MNRIYAILVICVLLLGMFAALNGKPTAKTAVASSPPATQPAMTVSDVPFDAIMLRAAREYKQYDRVDRQLRAAPMLCAAVAPPAGAGQPVFSRSGDETTHGRKLFTLYATNAAAYRSLGRKDGDNRGADVGQTIVKESWAAVALKEGEKLDAGSPPPVMHEGVAYRAGAQRELFIMSRLDPSTPGTDDGWVYGTVTPDGKSVTGAGRLQNCMSCHLDAPHGRLFGLARAAGK